MNEIAPVPRDENAERAVIGVCLVSRGVLRRVSPFVREHDFTVWQAQTAFSCMITLRDRGDSISFETTMSEAARRTSGTESERKWLNDLSIYLTDAAAHTAHDLDAETLARRVQFVSTQRRMIACAQNLVRVAYTPGENETARELTARAGQEFEALLRDGIVSDHGATMKEITFSYAEELERRQARDPDAIGIETGFSELDRFVAYRRGELWYIGAPPSVGKTALTGNMQDNLARRDMWSVYASVEQPTVQLMDRAVAAETGIDSWRIARGNLDEEDWKRVNEILARRHEYPAIIVDDGSLSTDALDAVLQYWRARHPVKVCFVDYVQLLSDDHGDGTEYARVSYVSHRLKQIARSLGLCIVATCQVSRKGAERSDELPRLSDLRDSGRLEQDADVVLTMGRVGSDAKLMIRKNRNGQNDVVINLHFDPQRAQFATLERHR